MDKKLLDTVILLNGNSMIVVIRNDEKQKMIDKLASCITNSPSWVTFESDYAFRSDDLLGYYFRPHLPFQKVCYDIE